MAGANRAMHSQLARPAEWHPQDWILVVEALCWYAQADHVDEQRADLAHDLVDEIAAEQGVTGSDLLAQADHTWPSES